LWAAISTPLPTRTLWWRWHQLLRVEFPIAVLVQIAQGVCGPGDFRCGNGSVFVAV
jgi:hypothetical protein